MHAIAPKCQQPRRLHANPLQKWPPKSRHRRATIRNPKLMAMSSLNRKVIMRLKYPCRLGPKVRKKGVHGRLGSLPFFTVRGCDSTLTGQAKTRPSSKPGRARWEHTSPAWPWPDDGPTIDFPRKNTCTACGSIANDCLHLMGKSLVIAEKPSVALDISRALGGFEKKDDFYEGDDYVIASAVGHLLELTIPPEAEVNEANGLLRTCRSSRRTLHSNPSASPSPSSSSSNG